MLITGLLLVLGLACLVFGADWFVKGAAGLADAMGVSPLVIGLTVVAYGTSMPELVVSAVAALDGSSAIALGNVVGSNIANIGLILGITALIAPPKVDGGLIKREIPILLVSAALVPLALRNGVLSRVEAIVLIIGAVAFTIATVRYSKTAPAGDQLVSETISETVAEIAEAKATSSTLRLVLIGLAGLALLLQGGRWFVGAAVTIAEAAGISERIIGLTVVAVGTSLPELAASVVAAVRGHSAMAVGNVIGSNIFNVFFVLGVAGVLSPIAGDLTELRVDLALMVGFSVLAAVMLRGERVISRIEGAVMLTGYIAAMLWLSGANV